MSGARPPTPAPEISLSGYTSRPSVATGGTCQLFVGGAPGEASLQSMRLLHGLTGDGGPGLQTEPCGWEHPRIVTVSPRATGRGSYVEAPLGDASTPSASLTLALWFYPTRIPNGWQFLAGQWRSPDDRSFSVWCADRCLVGGVSVDGSIPHWVVGVDMPRERAWQFVALVFDADAGTVRIHQDALPGAPITAQDATFFSSETRTPRLPIHSSRAPFLLGSALEEGGEGHWAAFDGKVARPILLSRALGPPELERLRRDWVASADAVLAAWDLSRDVESTFVPDVGGNASHGRAVNLPARAVTGPDWHGRDGARYSDEPRRYDAIHLHSDDVDDAGWPATASLSVPADARSGIYSARLVRGRDELFLPFVVRPDRPAARIAYLVPTLTWQAYGTNRQPWGFGGEGPLDEGVCLYDHHADRSQVYYVSSRQPSRARHPSLGVQAQGAHNLPSDLCLIHWLEHTGYEYDCLADHDLHDAGAEVLAAAEVLIIGTHPEYWTRQMLSALQTFLRRGKRLMYLGGNGLHWVVSIDPDRPWVMECRKSGEGEFGGPPMVWQPGEAEHSITGEMGGLWSRRLPVHLMTGVDSCANVFVDAGGRWGYRRTPESYDPSYEFVFAGVSDEVIGNFGLNLGSAAAYEMDAVQEDFDYPAEFQPAVLARAHHPEFFGAFKIPLRNRCDMALTVNAASGAAVFAASSVAWAGSLSHNAYNNSVARVSRNVLDRFLDTPAGTSILSDDRPDR